MSQPALLTYLRHLHCAEYLLYCSFHTYPHYGEDFYCWISVPQQTGMKCPSFISTEIKHTFFGLFFYKMLMALLWPCVEQGPVQSRPNKRALKMELTREFSRTEKLSIHNSASESPMRNFACIDKFDLTASLDHHSHIAMVTSSTMKRWKINLKSRKKQWGA